MARRLPLKTVTLAAVNGNGEAANFSYGEMMRAMLRLPGQPGQGLSFDEVLASVAALQTLDKAIAANADHVVFPEDQYRTLAGKLDRFQFALADPGIAEFGLSIRNASESGL